MKKYRRIEITAFRRRVSLVSGAPTANKTNGQNDADVWLNDADTNETITPESAEGRRILIEAVRLLEEKLSDRTQRGLENENAPAEIDFPKTL